MITADELESLQTELERLSLVVNNLRQLVHEARVSRGLSIRAAGAQMGVPPSTLARFEKGDGVPSVDTLLAVIQWIKALPEA